MSEIAQFLNQSPTFFYTVVVILGLMVGSFLNVVVYRLPIMMKREWLCDCHEFLKSEGVGDVKIEVQQERFNLVVPRSRCPNCQKPISAIENIPLLSFLFLKGKCKHCQQSIAKRYPIIELVTGLLSCIVAVHFGFTWPCLFALIFTWSLIAASIIDFDHHLLPDNITMPLLWLGLILALYDVFISIEHALLGAIFGYLALWAVFWGFKFLTGKEGMGYGDFKLLAALGAWCGLMQLPLIVLVSSLLGAIVGISMIVFRGHQRSKPIPFGPYLAFAGWISLLFGDKIVSAYLQTLGI